ncbi:nuclear transport factor 2 family protein [Sphingomonas sp. 28-63-12]|uniref:nuclear transport factor 2 family protein n=1 Tax=Sphingomonas sp. 28-63-12 TaxID=1970434 RepID=UPI000BC75476|nr:MAG: hypothetical protein B7Y47_06400 [Sphingomonas sp. 28-63-12]
MTPVLLLLAAAAQITPTPPLPKGTGLPPPAIIDDSTAVMTPVNALFAAIAARDGKAMAPLLLDGGTATIAAEKADGSRTVTRVGWADLTGRFAPGAERFEERLYDPAIEIDGDVALVWGRYDFYVNGTLHHCGYDHFDLVRDGGRWKIANLTWSSRTTGCEPQ